MSGNVMAPGSPPGPANKIRVLVVDDSTTQRMTLASLLSSDPAIEVVGWATNGAEAVRSAARLHPDVITMDLRMPVVDGLEATRQIMQEAPTRIVMVTASASRENQQLIFKAFDAGVLALLEKPRFGSGGTESTRELLRTVKAMANVRVIRRWSKERFAQPISGSVAPASPPIHRPTLPRLRTRRPEVVAIGASTGGPQALRDLLTQLPAGFPLPVLVVQHIALGFTDGLVEWLRGQVAMPIQAVTWDQPLDKPAIYVAPAGQHLVARRHSLVLSSEPLVSGHRPSATVLLQSVATVFGPTAVGVLLTGMGDDGAAGLRDVKRAGGVTIAQDEESCVVFGMPAVAIAMGVVDHVIPPPQIGALLVELERSSREV